MSVIFFGADEIGNVLAFVAHQNHMTEASRIEFAKALALVSRVNARAYTERYRHLGERAKGLTAKEILAASRGTLARASNVEQAIGTIQLLRYNCEEGKVTLSARTQDVVLTCTIAVVGWYRNREELERRTG